MEWNLDFTYTTEAEDAPFTLAITSTWRAHITGLFGASGCGKTTLLEILLGLKPAIQVKGLASCNGRTLFASASGVWLAPGQRRFGWAPQEAPLLPHMTVAGNLRFTAAAAKDLDKTAERLQLRPLLRKYPHQLSGGERQRVALARALLAPHEALLLDEPLSAIDRPGRDNLMRLLRNLVPRESLGLLYVTHDWREITEFCDYALVLDAGHLIKQGEPHALSPW